MKTGHRNHQLAYQEKLHNTSRNDGKKKKGWKPFLPQNNLIQNSEGNEENGYLVSDSNKKR
jgi:hypothetical protein